MKKKRKALLSMILSAAMVIAMLPGMSMVAKAAPGYTVTVQGGVAEVFTPEPIGPEAEIEVSAGTEVEIREMPSDLGEFIGWNADPSLTITGGSMDNGVFRFIMPAENVTITARYNTGGGGSSDAGGTSTPETHTHAWRYALSETDGVLLAKCEGCSVIPTLTIVPPELSRTGSGSEEATLLPDQLWTDNELPTNFTINYDNGADGYHYYDSAPTTAGNYIASITAYNNTERIVPSITYTISASSTSGDSDPGSGSGSTPQQNYTISNAAGCTVTANSEPVTSAEERTQITITAEDRTSFNLQFDHWKITENSATGTDITSTILLGNTAKDSSTTFSMPAKNIYVMPVFISIQDSGNSSDAQQEGSNDSILFRVGSNGFDIQGKDGSKNIQTTFSNSGYVTRMQVGSNSMDFSGFAYGKKYSFEGTEGNVTASLNGNSVAIVYTLKNTTNETKSVKIGSYADTQIGDDDDAPVSFTNKGIQMISKDGKYAFVVNPGNADFTTRWYGRCGERSSNVFNNRTDSETFTDDSGVAWSWSVEVPANTTVTRTAILAAGSAESIIEPQSDTNSSTATIAVSGETAVKGENPIVPNLNSEAASQGDDVTLDMQITADPETTFAANPTLNSEPEVKEEVKGQFKDESAIKVDVLHINVRKLVAGVFAATLTNTNSVLEIGVGYNFTGKYDPSLVSKHGDEVRTFATLTARPTAGNYINSSFFADTENDKFYIYSKDYSDFVISYSTVEGNAQNRTVINPNAGGSSSTSSSPKTIPVYRLFNKVNGNHLFTTNAEEKDILVANGWADEGIAWQVVANTATPVYRLFDAAGSGEHYYTANEALKAELIAKGCVDEGIAWYGQAATGRTVYKVTNTKYGKSVLTTSVEEKDALVAAGFTVEEADFKVN